MTKVKSEHGIAYDATEETLTVLQAKYGIISAKYYVRRVEAHSRPLIFAEPEYMGAATHEV